MRGRITGHLHHCGGVRGSSIRMAGSAVRMSWITIHMGGSHVRMSWSPVRMSGV